MGLGRLHRISISLNGGKDNQLVGKSLSGNNRAIDLFDASGNHVINNQVTGNNNEGILIELPGSVGNEVHGNTATNNSPDLQDDHGECASNNWTGNTFLTASPACIR